MGQIGLWEVVMTRRDIRTIILLGILLLPAIFSCTALKPVEFIVYKVDVNPAEIAQSDNVTVIAIIGNTCGATDNYTAILNVDGEERDRQIVTIKASENKTITFALTENNIGQHDVEIGAGKNSFKVYETSKYLLKNDNGVCSDSWCLYDPRGQWIKLVPPAIPFKINKICVKGKRTNFNNADNRFYTIKIWENDFNKELFSKDYPYSNFSTDLAMIEHQMSPPVVVRDTFIIDFISHAQDPGDNQKPNVALYTCVDFTVDSSQYNGASWIGTNDAKIKETAISNDARWRHASWIIQVEGTGKKADTDITSQASIGKQYKVFFDRRGDLISINSDGTEYSGKLYQLDRSPDGNTRVFAGETNFNYRALYLADADGTRPIIPIGGGLPDHMCPSWSPDGSKIAFSKSQPHFGISRYLYYDIWIMNPDGTEIKKLSDTTSMSNPRSHTYPQWFPDSKRIVYASNESGYWEIWTTPIDNYEPALIVKLQQTFNAGQIPWNFKISPDGKRMVYNDGPGTDLKTLVIDINSKKIMEWPNFDISEIPPVESPDSIVTIITKQDGLYYADSSHKETLKIPNTYAGDIAIKVE